MNYLLLIIVVFVSLGVGFLLGLVKGASGMDEVANSIEAQEAASEFLNSSSDLFNLESFQTEQTMNYIDLLEQIEKGNIKEAEETLLDSIGRSYNLSEEAIDVGMASDNDDEIVKKVKELSKTSSLFKRATQHEE